MDNQQLGSLRATLEFDQGGNLEEVYFCANSDREEELIRKALAPALRAYESRGQSILKRALTAGFCRGLMSYKL